MTARILFLDVIYTPERAGWENQIRDHAARRRFTLSLAPQQLENSEKSSITRAEGTGAADTWISVKGIWFVIVERGGKLKS